MALPDFWRGQKPSPSSIELPDVVFHHLVRVIRNMTEGKAVVLLPENEVFTTQAAADFLGVSRPFLVSLLDQGALPHHLVGSHRRVYRKDLMAYRSERDRERRKNLDALTSKIEQAGFYDSELKPEE